MVSIACLLVASFASRRASAVFVPLCDIRSLTPENKQIEAASILGNQALEQILMVSGSKR
jgi:hypothetical protein